MILQNSLANFSFLTLLGSMILYWIETSFTLAPANPSPSPRGPAASLPAIEDPRFARFPSKAKYGILISNILLALLLLVRWKESGHFPLSNLYESLMFLSWCFTSLHLYIDFYTHSKDSQEFYRKLIGAVTTPSALLTNAFATFTLPKEMQEAAPLVPALQSNWLMMHVTVMILSYAALILGSLLSIAFLIVTADFPNFNKPLTFAKAKAKAPHVSIQAPQSSFPGGEQPMVEGPQGPAAKQPAASLPVPAREGQLALQTEFALRTPLANEGQMSNKQKPMNQPIALVLDNLSYRILGIGFPLLTIGILSGAVWANEAWGSYWSWDPKETWALLTWLIFAIYLHTRLSKGWKGKKPAIIASFGFVIVWVCYLGVNLIGEGLHSYGWIVKS